MKSREHYQRQRQLVYDREKGRCVVCGLHVTTGSVHHRAGRGGPDPHRLSNLILVHGSGTTGCHGRIHAAPAWARQMGYMVTRLGVATTEGTPVVIGGRPVFLTNDIPERETA